MTTLTRPQASPLQAGTASGLRAALARRPHFDEVGALQATRLSFACGARPSRLDTENDDTPERTS
jgi:hypothetical protein